MVDHRMDALAATQHGLITRAQALALGLTAEGIRHRVRQGRWRAVSRGVFCVAGAINTPHRRALAAVLASGPGATLSHRSAAALHGLPGFSIEPLTVSVPRNGRRALPSVSL